VICSRFIVVIPLSVTMMFSLLERHGERERERERLQKKEKRLKRENREKRPM